MRMTAAAFSCSLASARMTVRSGSWARPPTGATLASDRCPSPGSCPSHSLEICTPPLQLPSRSSRSCGTVARRVRSELVEGVGGGADDLGEDALAVFDRSDVEQMDPAACHVHLDGPTAP